MGTQWSTDPRILHREDFHDTIRYLLKLRKGIGVVVMTSITSVIARVRAVGELLGEPVPHRPSCPYGTRHQGIDVGVPGYVDGHAARSGERQAWVMAAAIREFFGSSQAVAVHGSDESFLEITHKRRPVSP